MSTLPIKTSRLLGWHATLFSAGQAAWRAPSGIAGIMTGLELCGTKMQTQLPQLALPTERSTTGWSEERRVLLALWQVIRPGNVV